MTGLPEVDGVLSAEQCRRTAAAIAAVQLPSGAIPWFPGGHADPWDHVQAAMALSAAGLRAEAERAYEWSRATQRADGTWPAAVVGAEVTDPTTDANFCAYLATGVWHHWAVTGDRAFVGRMWPAVQRAIEAVLTLQAPGGEVWWARDPAGRAWPEAMVTGNASIAHSLRCAVALAELCGELRPEWELAGLRVRHAVAGHPERFADRARFSMDWYYPVLCGVLPPRAAARRIADRWDEFVVPGRGARCVADRPWVTGAETCELALALDVAGDPDGARRQLAAMQHLRDEDGSYWTGLEFVEDVRWPVERTTWTAATVILAADALSGATGGSGVFRGEGLAPAPAEEEVTACLATC